FKAGLALLCECGHECLSHEHSVKCNLANFTVIRKRVGPIRRIDDAKETPKCLLCDTIFPSTIIGYVEHLKLHHKSTLKENEKFLKCACSFEVTSRNSLSKHNKKVNTLLFS
ncbi:hypothetical protein PMAYCL1PPCAC_20397, partial [Pristionchus mayeri]